MTAVDEPPSGLTAAVGRVLDVAVDAFLTPDPRAGRELLADALDEFPAQAGCEGQEYRAVWSLMVACMIAVREYDPTGRWSNATGDVVMEVVNDDTGVVVDPDQKVAGNPELQGRLAAIRMLTAWCNDQHRAALDLFTATVGPTPEECARHGAVVVTLLDMAAAHIVERSRANGTLSETDQKRLRALCQEHADQDITGPGHTARCVHPDPRDFSPDDRGLVQPHGPGVYVIGAYPQGVPGARDKALTVIADQIEITARHDGLVLCPELHSEDVPSVDRLLHTGRPHALRVVAEMEQRTGRLGVLIRCWRHFGDVCPDTAPLVEDTPLFTEPT